MNEDVLQQQDGAAAPPPDPKEDVKDLREELKSLRGRVSEAENNAKFWYEKANTSTRPAQEPEEEEEDVKLDEDLVDVLSSGDTKKVKETFKKLGFVSEKDVQKRIAQTRQQIAEESRLFTAYPDLQDQESPLFTETAKEYTRLAKEFGESPKTLRLAAEMAAAKSGYDPKATRRQPRNDDDDDAEYEQERVQRVSAQNGARGRNSSSSRGSKPEEFTDSQRSIIDRFKAVGSSLTEDSYRKRAESGVRMGARNASMGSRRGR